MRNELKIKIQQMLHNYPEYSTEWIRCTNWNDYSNLEFSVLDPLHGDEHFVSKKVKPEDLANTYIKYGAKLESVYEETCEFFDMEMVDVFMQYHFYGKVVYG